MFGLYIFYGIFSRNWEKFGPNNYPSKKDPLEIIKFSASMLRVFVSRVEPVFLDR